jgi:diguanylate cyclase (GGDEF)-like protein
LVVGVQRPVALRPASIVRPAWLARAAAAFFAAAAALLAMAAGQAGSGVLAAAGVAAVLAVVTWPIPWRRLPQPAQLAPAVAALGLLVLVELASDLSGQAVSAAAYSVWVILVLVWVGLTQPPATVAALAVAAAAALAFVVLHHPAPALPLAAVPLVVLTGAVLGEGAAAALRRAGGAPVDATTGTGAPVPDLEPHLADLDAALADLEAGPDPHDAARVVAQAALAFFATGAVAVTITAPGTTAAGPRTAAYTAGAGPEIAGKGRHTAGTLAAPPVRVPLVGRSGDLGTVELPASAADRARCVLFARQVAGALEAGRALRDLHEAVRTDALTGTGNRHQAEVLLDAIQPGEALLIVDLDGFKTVNDTKGHRAGDQLLAALGRYLSDQLPDRRDVARYGGDELLLVLRGDHDARQTALDLVAGWQRQAGAATISVGVAINRAGEDGRVTLDRADQALYRAKASGRDRSAMAD